MHHLEIDLTDDELTDLIVAINSAMHRLTNHKPEEREFQRFKRLQRIIHILRGL